MLEGDGGEAARLLGRAKTAGVAPESLARIQDVVGDWRKRAAAGGRAVGLRVGPASARVGWARARALRLALAPAVQSNAVQGQAMKRRVAMPGVVVTILIIAGLATAGVLIVPRLDDWDQQRSLREAGKNLFGDDASADFYAQRLSPLGRDPHYLEYRRAAEQRQVTAPAIAMASYSGMARLSPTELESALELRGELAKQSPGVCAGLWRGGISGGDLATALRKLTPAQKRQWIELTIRAAELEVAATSPASRLDTATVALAWTSLFARLPEERRAFFERASKERAALSADEACQAFRLLAAEVKGLPPAERDTITRAVTCPFLAQ
jgi:hypothetical protein